MTQRDGHHGRLQRDKNAVDVEECAGLGPRKLQRFFQSPAARDDAEVD